MKNEARKYGYISAGLLVAFAFWTAAVSTVDVQLIGPRGSSVGLATLNGLVHNITGVHMWLYAVTDWLGLVPVAFALGFAIMGLVQWICRRNIMRVDRNILILGGFYIVVIAAYLFFEECVINYRPVLIEGYLEASYPSSTTLLVLCVMPTAMMQFQRYITNTHFKRCVQLVITAFVVFMVIGRVVSGVHWITDIIGSMLFSTGVVTLCHAISCFEK